MSSYRRRSSAASSRSSATCSAPSVEVAERRGRLAAASSAANPGQAGARRAPSSSSRSSPQVASPTGASIPAATPEAPAPGRRARARAREPALRPRARRRRGRSRRAPTTTTSCSLRSLRLLPPGALLSRAGGPSHLPAPALPGSGSDGRRPVAALSAHWFGAPVAVQDTPPRGRDRNSSSSSASSRRFGRGDLDARAGADDRGRRPRPQPTRRARCRGVARGHDEVREARRAEYRDPIGGMTWAPNRDPRSSGRDLVVVETEISMRGPLERDQRHRPRRLAGRASRAT